MTPSFYYCSVIWVPNANEFLEDGGSPELKNNFSKKIFYNHKKILLKSSFDHKKIFLRNHSRAQDSLWNSYQDSWRTLYVWQLSNSCADWENYVVLIQKTWLKCFFPLSLIGHYLSIELTFPCLLCFIFNHHMSLWADMSFWRIHSGFSYQKFHKGLAFTPA